MNLGVLEFAVGQEHQLLLDAVDESNTSLDAAIGVARKLIAEDGDLSVLSEKQLYVYRSCLEPLFSVPCDGLYGDDTCIGNGWIDDESLLMSYEDDEFLCQHCRYDSEKHADE